MPIFICPQSDAFVSACGNGQLETAQAMLAAGCRTLELDYMFPGSGRTALGAAAAGGHMRVVQWLHSLGARLFRVNAVKVSAVLYIADKFACFLQACDFCSGSCCTAAVQCVHAGMCQWKF